MRTQIQKWIILVFVVAIAVAGGCQESQTPSEKKSRVIAAQNMELQKQLAERNKQIDDLKAQYAARIGLEQKKLAECQKQTADCKQQLEKGMEEKVNDVLVASIEQNAKTREENATLKAEIAELRAKLNQPGEPEKPTEPEKKE
jgi:regulator of replication initiation timing